MTCLTNFTHANRDQLSFLGLSKWSCLRKESLFEILRSFICYKQKLKKKNVNHTLIFWITMVKDKIHLTSYKIIEAIHKNIYKIKKDSQCTTPWNTYGWILRTFKRWVWRPLSQAQSIGKPTWLLLPSSFLKMQHYSEVIIAYSLASFFIDRFHQNMPVSQRR